MNRPQESEVKDFPGGPVVKNPPSNAGDVGSIPSPETKIPHVLCFVAQSCPTLCHPLNFSLPGPSAHAVEQLSLHIETRGKPERPKKKKECEVECLSLAIFSCLDMDGYLERDFSSYGKQHVRGDLRWGYGWNVLEQ